jgi:hypothetical protein
MSCLNLGLIRRGFQMEVLTQWRMSAYGTKQKLIPTLCMSVFGGKADIADRLADVR